MTDIKKSANRIGFWGLIGRLANFRGVVTGHIIFSVLTAIFTVVSIPAIIPLFDILFQQETRSYPPPEEALGFSNFIEHLKYNVGSYLEAAGREQALIYICIAIVVIFFLKNLFEYLSLFFLAPIRNGVVHDLRQDLYQKVLHLPLAFFSDERKGDLIARITSDVQEVEVSILNVLKSLFKEPLIIVGSITIMLYISPQLTLFVFGLIIFTAVIIGGISRTLKKSSFKAQEKLGGLIARVEETLSGMRIIKGFNAEKFLGDSFRNENDSYRQLLNRILWRRDLSSPLSEFLGICVVSVLMWYGSSLVFRGALDAGTFLAFIFAFYNIITPSKVFSNAYYNVQKGLAALQRMDRILSATDTVPEVKMPIRLDRFQDEIRFDHVSFRYTGSVETVLDDVDLVIPKGMSMALVGASGAGKSTLVDLIPRFYDVNEGQIRIDGIDVRQIAIKDLRGQIGIVSQEPILFNDTIYNNIVFGKEGVSREQVLEAAKVAHAHEFIEQLENGYDTNIGDRGVKLSGGQRQRLTIARAILKDPPILILDEATSALDSESEKLVQDALLTVMKGRTSIVIAHRLSTIQHADLIVVLKEGKIVQKGTHLELLEQQDGEYRKFVSLQAF